MARTLERSSGLVRLKPARVLLRVRDGAHLEGNLLFTPAGRYTSVRIRAWSSERGHERRSCRLRREAAWEILRGAAGQGLHRKGSRARGERRTQATVGDLSKVLVDADGAAALVGDERGRDRILSDAPFRQLARADG